MNEIQVPVGWGRTNFIDARDIAATLTEELGRQITYTNPSILGFIREMRKRHFGWAYIGVMSAIYTVNKLVLAGRLTQDVERVIGRKPITFKKFASDYRSVWL